MAHNKDDADYLPAEKRFYGRRKGKKIKPGRQGLIDTLLPRLSLGLPNEGEAVDPFTLFPDMATLPRAIWLEIGFGGGEHLAHQALNNPDIGFIGAEPFLNGTAKLLASIRDNDLRNIRILGDDVRPLLKMLPEASLERVFLLFPDPWPKSRHAERRFISDKNLSALARLMVDDGEFRVASDHPVYQRWALRVAPRHPDFRWQVKGPEDWQHRWPDACQSRYEAKAVREGRTSFYLTFKRQPRV